MKHIFSHEEFLLNENKKWSKDIKIKGGKMTELLNIPEGKTISDIYTSGKKLASKLLSVVKGDKKKASSMLAFAANINPTDNVYDKALRAIKNL